jgi:preprotein translocase subunit SecF
MFRLFDDAHYDLLQYWRIALTITLTFAIPGLGLLAFRGLNLSIEFTGGTFLQVRANDEAITTAGIRSALGAAGLTGAEIQTFGAGGNEFAVRARLDAGASVSNEAKEETAAVVDSVLAASFGAESFEIVRTEAVGPKVGAELRDRAVLAILLSLGATFLVLWFRYEWRFGLAAVVATVHDVLSTMAFISYLNLEMSLVIVAALLLIIGYSLNDTIVTFDRVRENIRKFKREDLYAVLNRSVNETLPRTVLTSGTTLGATIALLILGGPVIRGFAAVVTFGLITGTFSSIYIAAPVLRAIEMRWPGEDARGARAIAGPAPAST